MPKARDGGRERRMVPDATPTSYYGRPVLKAPTWKWPIPAYLFTGGLAAGSALAGEAARLSGDPRLGRHSQWVSLGAVAVSGAFLVQDLGRPERFYNMLRVVKPTSPMSVGTWIFSAFSGLTGLSVAAEVAARAGAAPRLATAVSRSAQAGAALVAPALATYTAVLIADTAVPTWHEGHRQLPWLFAGSASAAGAGAVTAVAALTGAAPPRQATRMAVAGAALEVAADEAMRRHLRTISTGDAEHPDVGSAADTGTPHRLALAARAATVAGAVAVAAGGRRSRVAAALGGAALMAGSALQRFAIFESGRVSASDPVYTVGPQRLRLVRTAGRP